MIRAAVTFVHQLSGVEIYIHLHLPNILMGKLSHFEINQDKAFQEILVVSTGIVKVSFRLLSLFF